MTLTLVNDGHPLFTVHLSTVVIVLLVVLLILVRRR